MWVLCLLQKNMLSIVNMNYRWSVCEIDDYRMWRDGLQQQTRISSHQDWWHSLRQALDCFLDWTTYKPLVVSLIELWKFLANNHLCMAHASMNNFAKENVLPLLLLVVHRFHLPFLASLSHVLEHLCLFMLGKPEFHGNNL